MTMTAEITRLKGQRSFLHVTEDMEILAGDLARAVQQQREYLTGAEVVIP